MASERRERDMSLNCAFEDVTHGSHSEDLRPSVDNIGRKSRAWAVIWRQKHLQFLMGALLGRSGVLSSHRLEGKRRDMRPWTGVYIVLTRLIWSVGAAGRHGIRPMSSIVRGEKPGLQHLQGSLAASCDSASFSTYWPFFLAFHGLFCSARFHMAMVLYIVLFPMVRYPV